MKKGSIFNNYIIILQLYEKMSNGIPRKYIEYLFNISFAPYQEDVEEYLEKLYNLGIIEECFNDLLERMNSFNEEGKYLYPTSINCKYDKRGKIKSGTESNEPYIRYKNSLKKLNQQIINNKSKFELGKGVTSSDSETMKKCFTNFFNLIKNERKNMSGQTLFIEEGEQDRVNDKGMRLSELKKEGSKKRQYLKKEQERWKKKKKEERKKRENKDIGIFSFLFNNKDN